MTILLWWGLRDMALVSRVLLPPLLAILFVVTLLTVIGERLSLFHLVSLLLVLGIGLNYALFFNRPSQTRKRNGGPGFALTVCMLATPVGVRGPGLFLVHPCCMPSGSPLVSARQGPLLIAAILGQQRVSQ